MPKPDVLFVLTVDTEEEWQWNEAFPRDNCSVQNVQQLPAFQHHCRNLGIRPTYFVDYAVAQDPEGMAHLGDFVKNREAEVGAHLHPWCNPPYFGETTEVESHVINLPEEQVIQKLDSLTQIISQNIGVAPRSFRSGRWGINARTLQLLAARGFQVDSSVYPFYRNEFFSCEGAPNRPYWPSTTDALSEGSQRNIMEIPVTAGFNHKHFSRAAGLHNTLSSPALAWTKLVGVLWHTRLLRKLYLSPELTSAQDMNTLIDTSLANQSPVIHMYLHSSSLLDGATGLLDVQDAFTRICKRIAASVAYLQTRANVRFCTISEASVLLRQSSEHPPQHLREAETA
ncbi:WalW protein [Alteromonas aestuariivivens]|uniref:WalW protein n=1 Tax=Alteromonas aestuariivivens TaxID=1938339 RepID=A0A3D8MF23_9ALTE|nr:polysaccharide deacetylase family protein [Alteromonas aestuariivivens]RDV29200.1 WalW protein [Alteromonas aestuariivivens]